MDDSYRAPPPAAVRRVLARRSAGALAWRLVLAVAGVLTPGAAWRWGAEVPSLFVLAMVGFPTGLLWLGRGVHAWFVPQQIELDDDGIRFAWADTATLLPWMERHDREVRWAELRGVRTSTVSVNGLSLSSLVVTTADGSFEIPDRGFDRSADLVQRDILDFIARARERPVGAATAYVRRMQERYATPERLVARPWKLLGACAFFLPFIGFPCWMAWSTPFWLTYGFAAVAVGLFGWLIVLGIVGWVRDRVVVLRTDGLAIGSSEASARIIPWDEIRIVRRDVTNGKTEGIEIVQEDGTRTTLRLDYGRSLDALARAIDPACVA